MLRRLLYKNVFNRIGTFDEYDLARYILLILDSKKLLKIEYGVTHFYVLYYDQYGEEQNRRILDKLNSAGLEIIKVSEIIDDVKENFKEYILYDLHPNKKANSELARWILSNLFGDKSLDQ